jgi:hypothetical protein
MGLEFTKDEQNSKPWHGTGSALIIVSPERPPLPNLTSRGHSHSSERLYSAHSVKHSQPSRRPPRGTDEISLVLAQLQPVSILPLQHISSSQQCLRLGNRACQHYVHVKEKEEHLP